MASQSSIEWTDATWNPVTGCSKVSAGCKFCYAERLAIRLQAMGQPRYADGFSVTLHRDLLDVPRRWRSSRLVFVNSMSDLFHEEVPFPFVRQIFQTMAECPQQRSLTLQAVERLASVLVLPHPEREAPEVRRLQPDFETEAAAMRVVMEHERAKGHQVYDVSEKNLGYDVTSLDLASGDLRLIEVKGLGASTGTILLTPNERRVAEDRRDCYWLYIVTDCDTTPRLQEPVRDPARLDWHEVTKVAHYYLSVDAMNRPMRVREEPPLYGEDEP